jgi:hypothetical protein
MKSLYDKTVREDILRRTRFLKSDLDRLWGTMTCHQAVCHMTDGFRICSNEIECHAPKGFFNTSLGRWLAIDSPLPWPKARLKSLPVFFTTPPDEYDRDLQILIDCIERFDRNREQTFGESPAFGKLTGEQWSRLLYRHSDHHLAQFGC